MFLIKIGIMGVVCKADLDLNPFTVLVQDQFYKFEDADFKHGSSFFIQILVQKGPKSSNFANLRIFVLRKTWRFREFQEVDCKYDNGFSKLQPKNNQIRQVSSKTLSFFFHMKLFIWKNSRVLTSNRTIAFSNYTKKTHK